MHKILQNHLLYAFVANLKIEALYPESLCDKNLAIRKVFAFCDSAWRISIIGSKAFSAVANPCSKGCCTIIDCSGQVRLINLDQLSPLCMTSLTRELDLARAKIDTGSRKEIRISTSSGVLQNIFSASMLLRCFLCTNPCNSNFALLHNAKHLLSIVLVEDLSLNLNFICYTF